MGIVGSTARSCRPEGADRFSIFLLDYLHPAPHRGAIEPIIECQGRRLTVEQLGWLKGWVGERPDWSRKRLARELCTLWDWRDGQGRIKDFAARSLLLKLATQGWICLPALRPTMRRQRRRPQLPDRFREPAVIAEPLSALQPLEITRVSAGTDLARRWAALIERYHYLGFHSVGENLGYLVRDRRQRELAALLWGAAAWQCGPRDRHLGWSIAERKAGLNRIANNTRYVIFPWARIPHLASHVLGRIARRIQRDWQEKYAHGLDWLETFVEMDRFAGTCYRGAGWRSVGLTSGRSRQDKDHQLAVPRKSVWLLALPQ
jgi:hypothetical protein